MSEDGRKALKRKRKLRDELHMLKHAKRIKLAAVEKVLAEARHENFRFGGESEKNLSNNCVKTVKGSKCWSLKYSAHFNKHNLKET